MSISFIKKLFSKKEKQTSLKDNYHDLLNMGDKLTSLRSMIEIIEFKGKKAVSKTFLQNPNADIALKNEVLAFKTFSKYSWYPQVLEQQGRSITFEYLNYKNRLDKIDNPSHEILGEILWCLLDIFNEGYAHRDIHAKNIYVTDQGIKIIDYETIVLQEKEIDFFDSYDITGVGLDSPFYTANMGVMNKIDFSISNKFKIKDKKALQEILNETFRSYLYDSSITFKTLREGKERHQLQNKRIYASFNLKNLVVVPEFAQRNTVVRLQKFGINKEVIEDKSVLDFGSNIGGTLLALASFNPAHMLGLEFDQDKVDVSNKLAKYNHVKDIEFRRFDIETDPIPIQKFDVVFCLAVIEHLVNKERLFQMLSLTCNHTLYFEGNGNSDIDYIKENLALVGFKQIEYIGFSDDEKNQANNNRPLFIAKK